MKVNKLLIRPDLTGKIEGKTCQNAENKKKKLLI